MSSELLIGVGLLGGLGAVARFALDGAVSRRLGREFPYGTMVVNLLGAFLLGLLVGLALGRNALSLAGTGLIGAFTTFSTWVLQSQRLAEEGRRRSGAVNLAGSLLLGLAVTWLGLRLGALA